jgi:hypothetical protein
MESVKAVAAIVKLSGKLLIDLLHAWGAHDFVNTSTLVTNELF